ncbi:hypothetical protein ACU8KH_00810 [Lachancea thermotolerans]
MSARAKTACVLQVAIQEKSRVVSSDKARGRREISLVSVSTPRGVVTAIWPKPLRVVPRPTSVAPGHQWHSDQVGSPIPRGKCDEPITAKQAAVISVMTRKGSQSGTSSRSKGAVRQRIPAHAPEYTSPGTRSLQLNAQTNKQTNIQAIESKY